MAPNSKADSKVGTANAKDVLAVDQQVFASERDLGDDHVAIDGVVYSLNGWNHPGGDQIKLFGGNDVSVQYRMIHPFHAGNAGILNKMPRVGRLAEYRQDYSFGSAFERDLTAAVGKIVKPNERFATRGFWFRLVCYCSLYAACMATYVTQGSSWALCALFGVAQACIGLNVQHDANHGALSQNPALNEFFGFGADLIGGAKYLWLQQHWTHHAFTNDVTRDPDASSADPFFLFHNYPTDDRIRQGMHAFQHLYMFPVLSFYWLSSIFHEEMLTVEQVAAKKGGMRFDNKYLRANKLPTFLVRGVYLACVVGTPFYHHHWATALAHIWFMSMVESLTLAVPFALSHNFEDSNRYPTAAGQQCWYRMQVETSSTYGGKIAGYLTGGLNFQIEHHLFPRMSSAWYPYIQPAVMEVCKKHGVRYAYYPTFGQNLRSTINYIWTVGHNTVGGKKAD